MVDPIDQGAARFADPVSITGPGADKLTVRLGSGGPYRIFDVIAAGTTTFSGLTISDGNGLFGGGIQTNGLANVNVSNCTLSGNQATIGGGIAHVFSGGTTTITDCLITDNHAELDGGGIVSIEGTLIVVSSTISANSSGRSGGGIAVDGMESFTLNLSAVSDNTATLEGGGLFIAEDSLFSSLVVSCTISGNSAGAGGGISTVGRFTLITSTVSDNTATFVGGGILCTASGTETINLTNSTIVFNSATAAGAFGGGIHNSETEPVLIKNCLVALNTAESKPDVSGNFASSANFTSEGFNLIGKADGGLGFTAITDRTGTIARPLDPKLDPNGLQDNGGTTQTIAVLVGSPAIDQATQQRSHGSPNHRSARPRLPPHF